MYFALLREKTLYIWEALLYIHSRDGQQQKDKSFLRLHRDWNFAERRHHFKRPVKLSFNEEELRGKTLDLYPECVNLVSIPLVFFVCLFVRLFFSQATLLFSSWVQSGSGLALYIRILWDLISVKEWPNICLCQHKVAVTMKWPYGGGVGEFYYTLPSKRMFVGHTIHVFELQIPHECAVEWDRGREV